MKYQIAHILFSISCGIARMVNWMDPGLADRIARVVVARQPAKTPFPEGYPPFLTYVKEGGMISFHYPHQIVHQSAWYSLPEEAGGEMLKDIVSGRVVAQFGLSVSTEIQDQVKIETYDGLYRWSVEFVVYTETTRVEPERSIHGH